MEKGLPTFENPPAPPKNKCKERWEIQIGQMFNILTNRVEIKQKIEISTEQFEIIKRFADTRKDEDLNPIYILNSCEFKVVPKLM